MDKIRDLDLNSIDVGDNVYCNGSKKPMKVVGVSANYILMIQKMFGKTYYSVLEKFKAARTRNGWRKGTHRMGPDNWICGCPEGYHFEDEAWVHYYLQEFEKGSVELSRRAITLDDARVVKPKTQKVKPV